jgi:hypothetical protein
MSEICHGGCSFFFEVMATQSGMLHRTEFSNPAKYVDASFITMPLWDFTTEWSHSGDSVSEARALFIAATLLDVF